jgi:hypothetical protein
VAGERDRKGHHTKYSVTAEPDDNKGVWYYTDQTGIIRCETNKKATANSPECSY